MRIKIRPATPDDLDWMLIQLRAFDQYFDSGRSLLEDEVYARTTLLTFIENHLVLIADGEGKGPVGFIAGLITPHLFNPKIRVLAEMFWWVDPEHRGSRAGLMLLNEFTQWGKANVDWMTCALESHSPVAERHLARRGFKLKERSFLMEVV